MALPNGGTGENSYIRLVHSRANTGIERLPLEKMQALKDLV